MSKTPTRKVAVDAEAASYWTKYYEESGYGKIWTREIQRKVEAEMQKRLAKKTAGKHPTLRVEALGTAITDKGVTLDGVARYEGEKESRFFAAEFDHEGNVLAFDLL